VTSSAKSGGQWTILEQGHLDLDVLRRQRIQESCEGQFSTAELRCVVEHYHP
jgi:hypothetical protein